MATIRDLRRKANDLASSGKSHDAARIYEKILNTAAPDGEVAMQLGSLRRRLGDLAGARQSFERAAELFAMTGKADKAAAAKQVAASLTEELARPPGPWWRTMFWWRIIFSPRRRASGAS